MDGLSVQERLIPIATFLPWPEHDNELGFLNGGIIATLLDCHTAAAVLNESALQGWEPPPGVPIPFVTAGIDVRYLRPSPLDSPVDLVAVVAKSTEAEIVCDAELRYDVKTRATGHAVWKRWRSQ